MFKPMDNMEPDGMEEGRRAALEGPIVAVVGPTASGKSGLALRLAETFGGEIVNTDSMQVYRHLDIGTAKASAVDRARVPHHLLDQVDPHEAYSAGRYAADGRQVIARLRKANRLPVLCGGTGLYFRALLFGLAEVPEIPAEVRRRVVALNDAGGQAACRAELKRYDPQGAAALHSNDSARTQRALEVILATGKPLREFQRKKSRGLGAANVLSVGIGWERAELYTRINQRVDRMLAAGWSEEVRRVLDMGYGAELKPMRAIGYREIAALLLGERSESNLAADIAQRTRRYAKRQLTWFRNQTGVHWATELEQEQLFERVEFFLKTAR